jgi:hypothetical protein
MKKPAKKAPSKKRSTSKRTRAPKAGSKSEAIDPKFARLADVFAGDPRVTVGKMMASYGLKVDGKIFAMHVKDRFVAKLPKARVDALVAAGHGEPFDPGHGRAMKEWIAMRPGCGDWNALAREAHDFVGRRPRS